MSCGTRNITYLDPKSMHNDGLSGYFRWPWAIVLHTVGVQVPSAASLISEICSAVGGPSPSQVLAKVVV